MKGDDDGEDVEFVRAREPSQMGGTVHPGNNI